MVLCTPLRRRERPTVTSARPVTPFILFESLGLYVLNIVAFNDFVNLFLADLFHAQHCEGMGNYVLIFRWILFSEYIHTFSYSRI